MSDLAALVIAQFYSQIDVLLVIIVRLLSFFIVLPIFSGISIPNLVKVMFSLAFAIMLFYSGIVTEILYDGTTVGFAILIIKEFVVGFIIGFTTYIIFNIIYFAGQMIDYQIGFSMVSIFDPMLQIQVPITGNLLYFIMVALLVQTGGLNIFVSAIAYSYEVIPVGTGISFANTEVYMFMSNLLKDFFLIGMRLSMPIVGSLLIIDVGLGILVKAVPQMNVFVVGMPLKLLVGLVIMYFITPNFIDFFNEFFDYSYKTMHTVIRGLTP